MNWWSLAAAVPVAGVLVLITGPWSNRIAAFLGALPWQPVIWYYRAWSWYHRAEIAAMDAELDEDMDEEGPR